MNWLGRLVQKEILLDDTVLDVGCGIMQATTESIRPNIISSKRKIYDLLNYKMEYSQSGNLKCKSLLGCDVWKPYLLIAKNYFPTIQLSVNELDRFVDESYDVVICLDVLEHMKKDEALKAIDNMKRIARKKVIVYTPVRLEQSETQVSDSWGMGYNQYQKHVDLIDPSLLRDLGFKISFPEPDKNTFGIFTK